MQLLLFAVVLAITHQGHCFTDFRQDWDSILYVRPDNGSNTTCPRQPCKTLNQYANVSHLSNTWFMFMPGLHTLSLNFQISDLVSITLFSAAEKTAHIHCTVAAGFIFQNIATLTIRNLTISSCGQKISDKSFFSHFSLISFQAAVALKDVTALTMQSITIRDSNGYGMDTQQ